MSHHFECPPFSGNPLIEPLIFDWDDVAGTVSGPGAVEIRRLAKAGGVPMHPLPAGHLFSADPLKSRTDLAAIIGLQHRLPPELADAYPDLIEGKADPDYKDDLPGVDYDPALEYHAPEVAY